MNEIMFSEELLSNKPIPQALRSSLIELPMNVVGKLKADPSQLEAAKIAINQRVTLIQGPPGTGKTYVGVQLVKGLLKLNPLTRIMCLCYTNHALDSFLESLIDNGILADNICRLGNMTKISSAIQRCCLQKDEFSKFDKNQFLLHRSFQEDELACNRNIEKIAKDLKFSFTGGSWPHVKTSMIAIDAGLFDLFKQFEVVESQDGMRIVGRKNKTIDFKSGWRAWYNGQERPIWVAATPPEVKDLWTLRREERIELAREWSAKANEHKSGQLIDCFHEYNYIKRNHDALREESKVAAMCHRRIVAATTTFAAKNRNLLDSFQADILIVEEAAEILEAHILTNLSPSMKQLIMIGDHLQLRPKIEHYPLKVESGQGIDFDRSLFERLIVSGYPYCTLSVQHRMRPEISYFIKGTYPLLEDHPTTTGRDCIRGVASNVVFIDHREVEQSHGDEAMIETCSKVNTFEVKMIMKILTYLIQQGYRGSDMVVLTPYLGQMMALRQELRKYSHIFQVVMSERDEEQAAKASGDLDEEFLGDGSTTGIGGKSIADKNQAIRIATVDNFQGEEAKIIIASLVRSNENKDIGFVSGAERVNVLFSRARDGFFILGNADTFENARSGRGRDLWKNLLAKLRAKNCVFKGFPVKCTAHGTIQIVSNAEEFDVKCPEGGCAELCDEPLSSCPLNHSCQRKCHPNLSHSAIKCTAQLLEKCPRGLHDLVRICSQPHILCNGKYRFSCSAGHTCYGECHHQQIQFCKRCKQLSDAKRNEENRLQTQIEQAAKETEELELKLQHHIAKLEAEERIGDEKAKQRAIRENLAAATRKLGSLKSIKSSTEPLTTPSDVCPVTRDDKTQFSLVDEMLEIDISQELSLLKLKDKNGIAISPQISGPSQAPELNNDGEDKRSTSASNVSEKNGKESKMPGISASEKLESNSQGPPPKSPTTEKLPIKEKISGLSGRCVSDSSKTNSENNDFTYKIVTFLQQDLFIDAIDAIQSKYPGVASIDNLTDITRDIRSDFSCVDHSVLLLLAYFSLGLDSTKSVKAIHKFYDQCINEKFKELDSSSHISTLLYQYTALCIYGKHQSYFQKAQELAALFVENFGKNSFNVVIPNGWLRNAKSILRKTIINDFGDTSKDDIVLPKLNVEAKWNKIIPLQENKKSPSLAMDALLQLSSLEKVKEKFLEIFDNITLAKEQQRDLTSSNFNSLFYGNPGTGKTTVAQLFAQFLIEMKLLPQDCEILKKTGSELIHGGVTALQKALESMRDDNGGGVVFVDEAYQLDSPDGHRILDFILGQSERLKGDFGQIVWIFAGYTKNMEKLLEHNVGLPSRFPNKFIFEDYEDNELLAIFHGLFKRRGADVVSTVKGLSVKFKSETRKSQTVAKPIQMPHKSGRNGGLGVVMQKPDEIDEWGNVWRWDEANYTFVDAYGNTTGYGVKDLGTTKNPLIARKDGTPWLFDRTNKRWYDQYTLTRVSKTYPGKPFEPHADQSNRSLTYSFFATDDKWIRIAITRLGRLRGVTGFGNARAVRNLFDVCCKRQTNRIADLKRSGYSPDVLQFTRDDLLGPKASLTALCGSCPAYQELRQMEGLKEVKHAVDLIIQLVIHNSEREEREEKPLEVSLNRIFLGNPGTGKTTVAKLYAEILKHLGLLSKGDVIYKTCSDFIGSVIGKSEEITRGILEQAKGCVLVIDEAYGLYQSVGSGVDGGNEPFREAVINTLVEQIQGKPGEDRVVLMLGYKEEMERMLAKCNPGLSRRFQLENAFEFSDYDDDVLLTILKKCVKSEGLHLSEETARFAVKQLAKARARPHFGNAGAINNLLSNAKLRMQGRNSSSSASCATVGSVLKREDFAPDGYSEDVISEEELFSKLVGNEAIKQKLQRYRNLVTLKRRQGKDVKSVLPFSYIFTGAPGTGKTTVARLMGKMLCSLGVIPCEEVVEKSASDFQTGYVGQSGKQTRDIFEQALGRVLFIDEAYQLNPLVGGSFMSEVVDEIVKLLTSKEYKGKLVVILAGYERDIDEMLKVNQGLKSRFTERIHFDDFDEETIYDMLCRGVEKIAAESVVASTDEEIFPEECRSHLGVIASRLKCLPGFANGRDVETYLSKLELAMADQYAITESDGINISSLDIALEEIIALKGDITEAKSGSQLSGTTDALPNKPLHAFQNRSAAPPPFSAGSASQTSANRDVEMIDDESQTPHDSNIVFLSTLQAQLDRVGLNTASGVYQLSTLPSTHPTIHELAQDISTSCGMVFEKVIELLEMWAGDQSVVREKIREQLEEEQTARAEDREAIVPIWRCGVCGRADQPFIACYVQPFIVRYEKRRLK